MRSVLSKEVLAVHNAVRESLEEILGPGVAIEQCDFKTRRNWAIVGPGSTKYYTTAFKGRFSQKDKAGDRTVNAELTRGYIKSAEVARQCKLLFDQKVHQINGI